MVIPAEDKRMRGDHGNIISNTMARGKLAIKFPRMARENLLRSQGRPRDFNKLSLAFRGHLIANFPRAMILE